MTKIKLLFLFITFLMSSQLVQAQSAPDFSFTDIHGVTHNLQDRLNEGYIIVLDFFYVDCSPCVQTGAELEAIHNDYYGKNVEVWSISPFDSIPTIQEFRSANDLSYIMGGLEGGSWDVVETYSDSLDLEYYPTISVICPNGNLSWDIWPYTPGGAPEWREHIENCGVYDISVTSSTEDFTEKYPSSLFPNPAEDLINIDFYAESTKDVFVEIYDITGREILQKTISINNIGQQNEQLSVAKLFSGNYLLRLSKEGVTLSILPFMK